MGDGLFVFRCADHRNHPEDRDASNLDETQDHVSCVILQSEPELRRAEPPSCRRTCRTETANSSAYPAGRTDTQTSDPHSACQDPAPVDYQVSDTSSQTKDSADFQAGNACAACQQAFKHDVSPENPGHVRRWNEDFRPADSRASEPRPGECPRAHALCTCL